MNPNLAIPAILTILGLSLQVQLLYACPDPSWSYSSLTTQPPYEQKAFLLRHLRSCPRDYRALNTLGTLYLHEGKYELSRRLFNRAHELNPKEPRYRYNYLVALFYEERYLEALKGLADLYDQYPTYVHSRLDLKRARKEVETAYARNRHPVLAMILNRWEEILALLRNPHLQKDRNNEKEATSSLR